MATVSNINAPKPPVYAAPILHNGGRPVASDRGPNKPTTAGPETTPNRNTQRLQGDQREAAKELSKSASLEDQLGISALPQSGPSSASALQQVTNQNINPHQLTARLAAASVRS